MNSGMNAKKVFFGLAALNLLLILAIIGVFVMASNTVQKKSNQIAIAKADLESNDQLLRDYEALKVSLDTNQGLDKLTDEALPKDKDQFQAFNELDKFSKKTKMPVQQISFNAGTNKGLGQTLTSPSSINNVSILSATTHSQSTDYYKLLAFLKSIEDSPRLMQVSTLNISPDAEDPSLLSSVDMTIDIYLKTAK